MNNTKLGVILKAIQDRKINAALGELLMEFELNTEQVTQIVNNVVPLVVPNIPITFPTNTRGIRVDLWKSLKTTSTRASELEPFNYNPPNYPGPPVIHPRDM